MPELIRTENLVRFYGDRCAVRALEFSVEQGEVVGFLGPNGAGKTTTLNMISGNLFPTSGRVLINGIDLVTEPRKAKSYLGYLPDSPPLYGDLTVDEYLLFCAKLHRIDRHRRIEILGATKRRCGLDSVGKRLIANLSKGFRQRVGVAQAILHSPVLVILDEPTAGLDPIQIREMRELIRELANDHAVILSSHILPEVQSVCTRTLIIHQGRLILDTDMQGLQQTLERSSLLLKTRIPLEISILQQISGVDLVDLLSEENRYRIFFPKNQNPAEEISATVVRHGWGLLELQPEFRTVEELFLQLTDTVSATEDPRFA